MRHLHSETVEVVNTRKQVLLAAAVLFLLKVIMSQDKPFSPLPGWDSSQLMACLLDLDLPR